ncbi:MAG: DUF481 domain-containing protein [Chitinophagaceae bacterium]|nr:DUF481 domain-containing protein [Chitinophagaceae bacterium]
MNQINIRTAFTALGLLATTQYALAQINESDTLKWQFRVSLTGSYQQGNAEILNIRSRLEFLVRPDEKWAFKSQISSLYTQFFDRKIDNDINVRNFLYFQPEHRLYGYIAAFAFTNHRRKLKSRYVFAAGPTWQAIRSKNFILKLSANMVYESSLFKDTVFNQAKYNGQDKINLWRYSLYAGGWGFLFNNRLRLYYELFLRQAFNNSKNYRTHLEVGFDFPVWRGLSFNTVYTSTHENVVVKNIKEDDRILTFGLSYLFRKKMD